MRVVRTLLGILLLTLAVIATVGGGALWVASGHESDDGSFSAAATGLTTPGHAIVVPDVDAFLRAHAPFARVDRTSVTVDGETAGGPVFLGLAPLPAVLAYLGSAPYGTVTGMRVGPGGPVPVTMAGGVQVGSAGVAGGPGAAGGRSPAGVPGAQRFWTASGTGRLTWTPASRRDGTLALVIMRPDAAAGVTVNARVAVRPGWLGRTAFTLFAVSLLAALGAVALLLWPARRREIVYVVEPAQLPELAERLGVTGSYPVVPVPAARPIDPPAADLGDVDRLAAALADDRSTGVPYPRDIGQSKDIGQGRIGDRVPGRTAAGAWAEPPRPATLGDVVPTRPGDRNPDYVNPIVDFQARPATLSDLVTPGGHNARFLDAGRNARFLDAGPVDGRNTGRHAVPRAASPTDAHLDVPATNDPGVPPADGHPPLAHDLAGPAEVPTTSPADVHAPTAPDLARPAEVPTTSPVDAYVPIAPDLAGPPQVPTTSPAEVYAPIAPDFDRADPIASDVDQAQPPTLDPPIAPDPGLLVRALVGDATAAARPTSRISAAHPSNVSAQAGGRRANGRLRRLRVVDATDLALAAGRAPEPARGSALLDPRRFVDGLDDPWTAPSSRARGPRHAAPESEVGADAPAAGDAARETEPVKS